MRPRSYFLLAVASAAVVLIAAVAASPSEQGGCANSHDPGWLAPLTFLLGAVSVAAIFASIIAYGRRQETMRGSRMVTWIVQAALGAGIWGVVGFFALFAIVVPSGCLD